MDRDLILPDSLPALELDEPEIIPQPVPPQVPQPQQQPITAERCYNTSKI